MIIEKIYVGKAQAPSFNVFYYMLKKDSFYGIEIVEEYEQKMLSSSTYFTENDNTAYEFTKLCCAGSVTLITLNDIIDDMVSSL